MSHNESFNNHKYEGNYFLELPPPRGREKSSSTEGKTEKSEKQAIYFLLFSIFFYLKGVFAKNERGYRLNAIKKRF